MAHITRARIAGILAISLLTLSAPGAMAGSLAVDAAIRRGSDVSYTGQGTINTTGAGQEVLNSGVVGQKLTFFIKITNVGSFLEQFKVKRSAGFNSGYRVRYYDASNNDVTWQVTQGTFMTPFLSPAGVGHYEMRVTVKIRTQATVCSFTSRLITVTSTVNSDKDAVRFTAELAGCF